MKTLFRYALVCLLLTSVTLPQSFAQSKKRVNETCTNDADCESGYCVKTRDGDYKCSKCDQSTLDRLTDAVEDKCKNKPKGTFAYADLKSEFGSSNEVSLIDLKSRQEACRECLAARVEREGKCWEGGDSGHKRQIDDLKDALNYLDGLINEKTRNKLAYYCDESRYQSYKSTMEYKCRDVTSHFEKYGLYDEKEVYCRDIESLIDQCEDCRDALEDLLSDCFKDGLPEKLDKLYKDVKDMESISKETLSKKKDKGLCK